VKKRYFIYFSYLGTAYHGWQIQPNGISVQEVLSQAMSTVLRTKIELTGAGRTDAGVHAKLMVAHFEVEAESTIEPVFLSAKLNSFLPNDISIFRIVEVKPDAHARFDAISRRYEYHITYAKDVFKNGLAAKMNGGLNMEAMNIAANSLMEYSDFTSFSKLHSDAKTNICKIHYANWSEKQNGLVFTIQADRFLRNMVRAIVGTLVEVGRNKMKPEDFKAVIEAKNRCAAGTSVPAHGLYLVDIQYPQDIFVH